MSADNGYVIRKNSAGKFVLQMYFMSDEGYPEINRKNAELFDTLEQAILAYSQGANDTYWSEYGLDIHCDHVTYAKEEEAMSFETQKYVRKPFEVEAIQVTAENIVQVAVWCGGELVNLEPSGATRKTYIDVKVHRPQTPRQTKAFIGDWVLYAGAGFKVYLAKPFEKSFDSLGVAVMHPEITVSDDTAQELLVVEAAVSPATDVALLDAAETRPTAAPSPAFLAALADSKNAQRS